MGPWGGNSGKEIEREHGRKKIGLGVWDPMDDVVYTNVKHLKMEKLVNSSGRSLAAKL